MSTFHTTAQVQRERARLGAEKRTGRLLPYFLFYDLLVCLYFVHELAAIMTSRNGTADAVAFAAPEAVTMHQLWEDDVEVRRTLRPRCICAAPWPDLGRYISPPRRVQSSVQS